MISYLEAKVVPEARPFAGVPIVFVAEFSSVGLSGDEHMAQLRESSGFSNWQIGQLTDILSPLYGITKSLLSEAFLIPALLD
jgi:hypothetical protein